MKQNNTGIPFPLKQKGLIAASKALLSFALLFSLQLVAGKASAQTAIPTTALTCTKPTTATSSCTTGGGLFGTGMSTGDHWDYAVNTCGYTGITMSFNTSSSGTGPTSVSVYYNNGSGLTFVTSYTASTSCKTVTVSLPSGCDNQSSLDVRLITGSGGSGGTNRVSNSGGFKGTAGTPCTAAPLTSGSVSASASTLCSGTSLTLTATPPCGNGFTYQWYDASGLISGATSVIYTSAPTTSVTSAFTYSFVATCPSHGSAGATTQTVTVDALPAAGTISTVSGSTTPLVVGTVATLSDAGAAFAGPWASSAPSVASIDGSGNITGNLGGSTNVTYSVLDPGTGCTNVANYPVSVVFAGDLSLYAGFGGNSTGVISAYTTATVTPIAATGFGTTTPCTSGGISGLTESTAVTSYSTAGPNVHYDVTPTSGNALRLYTAHVSSRSSSNGPAFARLAYSTDGGATWTDEGADHTLSTSGSCGANTNEWYWDFSPSFTTTSGIRIAIFPNTPATSTGTFQVQQLELLGTVVPATTCSSVAIAGVITPSVTTACATGHVSLSFAGDPSVGVNYQWQSDEGHPGTFTDIAGANAIFYKSQTYTVVPTTINYQVNSTCLTTGTVTTASAGSVFDLGAATAAITAVPTPYLFVGQTVTLSDATPGGTWTTGFSSCAFVDGSGDVTGLLSGIAPIHYSTGGFGQCSSTASVSVIYSNDVAVYLGTGGVSTGVTAIGAVTVSSVTATGFGTAATCGSGGISGLTVSAAITGYTSSGPHVSFTTTPVSGSVTYNGFIVTTKSSGTGPTLLRLAYNDGGTGWVDNGSDIAADVDNCGFSHTPIVFNHAAGSPLLSSTNTVEWAVYAFAPGTSAGTFQVNTANLGDCGSIGTITDQNTGNPLNTEIYGASCTDINGPISLTCAPAGGTWISSDPSTATVDPTGNVLINSGIGSGTYPVTITYTDLCGDVSPATFTVAAPGTSTCDGSTARHSAPTAVANVNVSDVTFYPNPASNTLNISAAQKVNVSILSIDGKTLISQNEAKSINVNELPSGIYLIKVYDTNNALIKTGKFTKE